MAPHVGGVIREDPLAPLLSLPGLASDLTQCRATLDEVLSRRSVRLASERVAAESRVVGAWANAAMEGAVFDLTGVRSGDALDESPVGRTLRAARGLAEMAPELASLVGRAPAQALARLQVMAALATRSGRDPDLGRPRAGDVIADPLHLGALPSPADLPARLGGVSAILRDSRVPGLLVAAVVHGELAWLRPFPAGSGMVARALDRVVLAQRGVDPGFLSVPEAGHWRLGRATYVRALRGYGLGGALGMRHWVGYYCQAVAQGAAAALG